MEPTQKTPYHNSEGWTRHLDTQYQTFYYSHPEHGSRWDDPNEAPASELTASAASRDLQDDPHNQEGVRQAGIVERHGSVTSSSSYSPTTHVSPGTLPKYSGTAQNEIEARQRELKGAMLASRQGSAFLSSENMRETALHERDIVDNMDHSVVRELSAAPVVEAPGLASVQPFGVYPQAEQPQPQFSYHAANAYQQQPFLQQQHQQEALYHQASYGAYQPHYSQPPLGFMPSAPVGMPAGLYAPISFPPAPESSFSSMTEPIKEPMTEEELYFARLPQGAKRVSYIPTSGTGTRLAMASMSSSGVANEAAGPSKLQNVISSSNETSDTLSEEEAYFARLPAGAQRVVHAPSNLPEKKLPIPFGGGYGTNDNPDKKVSPIPVASQPTPQPPAATPLPPLSRRERRNNKDDTGRRFCCCFRTRRGCCAFALTLTLVILGGLGAAAFFLWPRAPQVTVGQPYLPTDKQPVVTSGSLLTASTTTPFVVELYLNVDVQVYSPNYETIVVNNLVFAGTLLDTDGATPIPTANVNGNKANVPFPGMSNTTFTMPLTLIYSITNPATVVSSDKAFSVIQQNCLSGGGSGKLSIQYTVSVNLAVIAWTGYKPSFSGKTQFPCPPLGGLTTVLGGN